MSINHCASSIRTVAKSLTTLIFFCFIAVLLSSPASASETIIVNIILNRVTKGEFFVILADDGDFLVKAVDLQAMGVTGPFPKPVVVANEPHVPLKLLTGVTHTYNENKLLLEITATPELLPKRVLDFIPQPPLKVYFPRDSSAFFNYRMDYFAGDSFNFRSFNIANELGIRRGNLLLLSDSAFTKEENGSRFIRLLSSLIYDRRQELQRIIVGDFTASSGDLGAGVTLGGISFSKLYQMDPYLINRPSVALSGLVPLPSEVEIYLNGSRIRTDRLSPGRFELKNITGSGGAGLVEVVIRDSFGREQRIRYPFYFTDILLKKGLHEYSYNIGALRKEFGSSSFNYGDPAFSAFHRYGVSDSLTLGIRGEWSGSTFNLGTQASFLTPGAGTFNAAFSGSHAAGAKTGYAATFSHSYLGKLLNSRLLLKGYSRDYATIDPFASLPKPRYEADAAIGYGSREFGSASLEYTSAGTYQGDTLRAVTTSYSRNLIGNTYVTASYKRVLEPVSGDEFFVNLNYYPSSKINLSASLLHTNDATGETLQLQKNQPLGEGIGFRATLERSDSPGSTLNRVNPSVQYNGPYGIYAADYSWLDTSSGSSDSFRLSASGAIVYAGMTLGLTRPVSDSFALVKVGEVEGVRVNLNNQEIARTNAAGKAFVPNLGSFNYNQVSVIDKDIPIDYLLSAKQKQISPPYRSGSCVVFDATRLQAVTGKLAVLVDATMKPLEFYEISIAIAGKPLVFQTGSGGEFYLDNYSVSREATPDFQNQGCSALDKAGATFMNAGGYTGSVSYEGKTCTFSFELPGSADPMIDLGTIISECPPSDEKQQSVRDKSG